MNSDRLDVSEALAGPPPHSRESLQRELDRCWPQAQARWSRFLLLNDPELNSDIRSVAQIQLNTRQITLNDEQILRLKLGDCMEGLLAHEVGHHVKYPGTLVVEARMRMLEQWIGSGSTLFERAGGLLVLVSFR